MRPGVMPCVASATFADDVAGDVAAVERVRSVARDGREGLGERGILQQRARGLRAARRVEEVACGRRVLHQSRAAAVDRGAHPRADAKTVGRERDAGLEQRLPWQPSVLAVRELEHPQHAGDADRTAAGARVGTRPGPIAAVVDVAQVGRRRRGRRGLAAVVRVDGSARLVVDQHERAAADAGRLRLDQVEDHLCGDRGVDGAAAANQHVARDARRDRVGGDRHQRARGRDVLAREAGGDLRAFGVRPSTAADHGDAGASWRRVRSIGGRGIGRTDGGRDREQRRDDDRAAQRAIRLPHARRTAGGTRRPGRCGG